ncbi:MAG: hypothetical protein WC322_02945 [Candidatus Paceibacterota bacterium]|jgi:hypothetical protein
MAQTFFLVDVEACGQSPIGGFMTEFGVVELKTKAWFHGKIYDAAPSVDNPAVPDRATAVLNPRFDYTLPDGTVFKSAPSSVEAHSERGVHVQFCSWVAKVAGDNRPAMFSDNPAYDYQWLNCALDDEGVPNPFGHTARRIGDLYAGLKGNWRHTTDWKRLRKTAHTHNPVDDSMGNAEALEAILTKYGQVL